MSALTCLPKGHDVPQAPAGYTWQEIPELKAAFLRPTGWYFKSETNKDTLAYFITKEEIKAPESQFSTGLTINVFQKMKNQSAPKYAKNFIDQLAKTKGGERWSRDLGPVVQFGLRSRDTGANGTIIMYTLMLANKKTNTLYLFIYESPEPDWDLAWKTGETIMEMLAIDDDV